MDMMILRKTAKELRLLQVLQRLNISKCIVRIGKIFLGLRQSYNLKGKNGPGRQSDEEIQVENPLERRGIFFVQAVLGITLHHLSPEERNDSTCVCQITLLHHRNMARVI